MFKIVEDNAIASTFDVLHSYPEFTNLLTLDVAIFQDLRETIGEDLIFSDLVTLYLNSAENLIESIQTSFADRDINKFSLASHSLKSISASVGAARLSQICKYLEKLGNKGEVITSSELITSSEIMNLLIWEYTRVVAEIKTHVLAFMPDY
jgi:HPt (histidine-containing phosphotransfer) domain-containing protein